MTDPKKVKPKQESQTNMNLSKSQKKALKEKEKQRIRALKQQQEQIERKNQKKKKRLKAEAAPKSCQDTLRYKKMYESGICLCGNNFYSKMIKFSDINYQVAQRDEQIDIFSTYCEILNYFDPNINVQITVHNKRVDKDDFKKQMLLKMRDDGKDDLRQEYNEMLLNKALQGQISIIQEKFVTFGLEAENYDAAYSALARVETDLTSRFKSLGCDVMLMSGLERLEHMNSILNPSEPLRFDYDDLIGTGLTTKDIIAPYFFDFRPDNKQTYFEFGDYFGQVLMIKKYPTDMNDRLLNKLLEIPCNTTIAIHTNSMDNSSALNMIQTKMAFMEQDIVNSKSFCSRVTTLI